MNIQGNGGRIKCDGLISTPLRLVHAIKEEVIDLSQIEMLILDEADRLFELGFVHDIDTILEASNSKK